MQSELTSTERKVTLNFLALPSGSAKYFYSILLLLYVVRERQYIADPLHSKPAPQLTLLSLEYILD